MRLFHTLPLVAAAVLAAVPATSSAQVGRKLDEVRGEDFWTFFGFQPTGPAKVVEGGTTVEFRPRAERFAPLVRVTASLDQGGAIRQMEMAISREFVDHPANGIFARDVVKSFLLAAVPADDAPDVETLVNEIQFPREDAPGTTTVRAVPAPALPGEPTPPYRVFLGRDAEWSRTLEASTLRLRNDRGEGGSVLVLTVAAR